MTNAQQIGWGIVGLGRIAGTAIAPAVTAAPNSTLAAVCSRDAAKRQGLRRAARRRVGLRRLPRAARGPGRRRRLHRHPERACTPTRSSQAAEAGKHVLCDKPLATTVADAERALRRVRGRGRPARHHVPDPQPRGHERLRQLLADGEIGSVRLAQIEVGPGRALPEGWRTDPALAGAGVMNNLGVHAYDLLRYLLGAEVIEATAVVDVEAGLRVDTMALALLRFDNGALAYVNANQSVPNSQSDLSIYGTEGTVLGRSDHPPQPDGQLSRCSAAAAPPNARSPRPAPSSRRSPTSPTPSWRGATPARRGCDALRSVQLTDALSRSAQEQRTVRLGG